MSQDRFPITQDWFPITQMTPSRKELFDVLNEWLSWANIYYEFVGLNPQLIKVMERSVDILARKELRQTNVRTL